MSVRGSSSELLRLLIAGHPTKEDDVDDAQTETIIDRRVQSRLATDRDYLFAENAEEQALAERKIELQEERAVLVASHRGGDRFAHRRIEDIEVELEQLYEELKALASQCLGHPAGPFDPMGQTVYCDGSCRR